jgi:hypothetical protein
MGLETLVVLVLAVVPPAFNPPQITNPNGSTEEQVLYVLENEATYVEGCFDPCDCPIMAPTGLEGSFLLTPAGGDGEFLNYELSQLSWLVMWQGEVFHRVEGTGVFRLDENGKRQQLLLNLSFDGEAPLAFDSGVVPLEAEFPELDVTVSMNGMVCYDRVFHLVAVPNGKIGVASESTWGTLKARFLEH